MKLPCIFQFRILKEAIKAAVTGPYTSKFPFKPHIPKEAFRGAPEFHDEDCVGCTACAQVCPSGAITFEDKIENGKAVRKLTLRHDICIFCGQCEANCITKKGVVLGKKFDLTTFNRKEAVVTVEKELVLCEICKTPVGTKDHIIWLAEQLGPLAYSNPSLFLSLLRKIELAPDVKPRDNVSVETPTRRFDSMHILCPRCRRKSVLKESLG